MEDGYTTAGREPWEAGRSSVIDRQEAQTTFIFAYYKNAINKMYRFVLKIIILSINIY